MSLSVWNGQTGQLNITMDVGALVKASSLVPHGLSMNRDGQFIACTLAVEETNTVIIAVVNSVTGLLWGFPYSYTTTTALDAVPVGHICPMGHFLITGQAAVSVLRWDGADFSLVFTVPPAAQALTTAVRAQGPLTRVPSAKLPMCDCSVYVCMCVCVCVRACVRE